MILIFHYLKLNYVKMRIIHISDTHLGKRPKRTRSSIINQEIKPLEDDFYNSWRRFIEEILNLIS